MSFFHPLFLIALAGMLVPIILHLLNRRHAKLMEWGATQFLLGSLVSRRRRLLLEEMMLLAMRCLLCALAVLVIARPLIQATSGFWSNVAVISVLPLLLLGTVALAVGTAFWQERIWRWRLWAAGALMIIGSLLLIVVKHKDNVANRVGTERDLAIVIDASSSMNLKGDVPGEDKTNFQRAVDEAKKLVAALNNSTTVTVVLAGASPKVINNRPLTQRDEIERVLNDLKPLGGSAAIRPAIQAAWLKLQNAPNGAKQIVVFSDQQRNGWQVDDSIRWNETVEGWKSEVTKPQIFARALAMPPSLHNLTVTRLELDRRVVGTDRPVKIDVEVKNTGTQPVAAAKVELKVDGEPVDSRAFSKLEPGNTATVSFSHRFAKSGARVVEASAAAKDDLADDNVRYAAVRVMERLPVLIVNSGPEQEFLLYSSAYAQLALEPGAAESPGESVPVSTLVNAQVVDPLRLGSLDLSDYRVVILADVPRLADEDARRLAQYVAQGGGLLVAPGGRAIPDFYNHWQQADGQGALLPAQLKQRHVVPTEEKPIQLALSTLSHPSLRPFADAKTDLNSAMFRAYWQLSDPEGRPIQSSGNFTNGDPLLIEKKSGNGAVALMSTSLDVAGSNFATRKPAFPIFMHLMVYHLADLGRSGLTFEAGQQPTLSLVGETGRPLANHSWQPGLKGEYFAGGDFKQKPVERIDKQLDFDWQSNPPVKDMKPEKFAVRWSGSVVPEKAETITLYLTGQGSGQLWWDDKPLITRPAAGTAEATVTVQAKQRYRLRVEETKTTHLAAAKLEWKSPSRDRQVIPASALDYDMQSHTTTRPEDAYELTGPNGTKERAESEIRDGVLTIKLPAVPAPGVYYVKPPDALKDDLPTVQDDSKRIPVAMTASPQEADFAPLVSADWSTLAQVSGLELADGPNAIEQIARGNPFGKELWKYLAFCALVILIAEIALTRWIAIQRQVTADPVSEFEIRTRTGEAAYLQRFATPQGRPSVTGSKAKKETAAL